MLVGVLTEKVLPWRHCGHEECRAGRKQWLTCRAADCSAALQVCVRVCFCVYVCVCTSRGTPYWLCRTGGSYRGVCQHCRGCIEAGRGSLRWGSGKHCTARQKTWHLSVLSLISFISFQDFFSFLISLTFHSLPSHLAVCDARGGRVMNNRAQRALKAQWARACRPLRTPPPPKINFQVN